MSGSNRAKLGETLVSLSTERLWTVLELAVREREMNLCCAALVELALRGYRVEFVNADTPMRRSQLRARPRGSQE